MHFYHNYGIRVWRQLARSIPGGFILSRRTTSCSSLLFCNNPADNVIGLDVKTALTAKRLPIKLAVSLLLLVLIGATPAHAFRCGNKIVIEDMHKQQVLAVVFRKCLEVFFLFDEQIARFGDLCGIHGIHLVSQIFQCNADNSARISQQGDVSRIERIDHTTRLSNQPIQAIRMST